METTMPLKVADMGTCKSWEKDMQPCVDAGSIWDSIIFLDEKNGILTDLKDSSTTGEICASPSSRWSDLKLDVGISWFGPLLAPMASRLLLYWQEAAFGSLCVYSLNIFYRMHIWTIASILSFNRTTQAYVFYILAGISSVKRGSMCLIGHQSHLISTPLEIGIYRLQEIVCHWNTVRARVWCKSALTATWDAFRMSH